MGVLGILGGLGPYATLAFLNELVELTPAKSEQDHIPIRIEWRPDTPNRQDYFNGSGEDPWPALFAAYSRLAHGDGACDLIAMPCNTTHVWHERLRASSDVPFVHIADCAADALDRQAGNVTNVAVLGTRETMRFAIYEGALKERGMQASYPDGAAQELLAQKVIPLAKAGRFVAAASAMQNVISAVHSDGADAIILACTEMPLLEDKIDWLGMTAIDSSRELARYCAKTLSRTVGG